MKKKSKKRIIRSSIKKCRLNKSGIVIDNTGSIYFAGGFIIPLKLSD